MIKNTLLRSISKYFRNSLTEKITLDEVIYKTRASHKSILVNLGCGSRFHNDWINIDINSMDSRVINFNLKERLPFETGSCDAVYSSHLIEHFDRNEALEFLLECKRILKQGGIIRLVTPDLERLIEEYLHNLKLVRLGVVDAKEKYNWIIIELLDQLVRNKSGGEMLRYWTQTQIDGEDYIISRVGSEFTNTRQILKEYRKSIKRKLYEKLLSFNPLYFYTVGKFRLSGEPHLWMYDSYSLTKVLLYAGFEDIALCGADTSTIPNFSDYNLDSDSGGLIFKPDSFFIEAKKQ